MLEIAFGIMAGIITGLGMGGGTILILLLSLFTSIEQHIAQGANLVFFIPTSIAAIIINAKQKNINLSIVKPLVFFGIIGASIGAIVSQNIDSMRLKKLFAIFILLIAIHEIYDLYKLYRNKRNRHTKNI